MDSDRLLQRKTGRRWKEDAMLKRLGVALTILMFGAGLALTPVTSQATIEYAKKEKKACTVCHTKAGSKDLNDVGKCYEKNKHSLKGCESKEKKEEKKK
jgi:hypothetical protein